ncbi:hypothetical protein FEF22_000245 [Texas Phoenix palm phytoplasma]|uniref:Uncharacterized protein n=1 Tax=Texas Phoenix palm phytoplasma TaxID=176709 RepID=A0ABS5BI10_9MOLU|nr:hypothetical protein [Texas Phoenix palm phytoplasma]MBP3059220.1 hypothetical protein [Texas Phoenix palm phytoplasma]
MLGNLLVRWCGGLNCDNSVLKTVKCNNSIPIQIQLGLPNLFLKFKIFIIYIFNYNIYLFLFKFFI